MLIGRRKKGKIIQAILAIQVIASLVIGVMVTIGLPERAEAVYLSPLNNYRPKDHGIIRKDGVWHVYSIYVCIDQTPPCNTAAQGLMHLTSTDLTNWTEVGYVVPPGTAGAWDDYDVWAPSIVERNGTYYMFYTGVDQNGSNTLVQKIGIATSTDLYTWNKLGSTPVINCDDFTWAYWDETNSSDGAACRDPYVFWDESEHQWVMLLSGRTSAGLMVIGIATSEDLTTWREYGYIPTTANGTAESAHYIEHNGTHYVVYTDNQTIDLKYVSSSTSLYTGYGAETVTSLEDNAYASEYYKDTDGREYFTRVDGTTNLNLDFDELIWSGSPFTVQEPSFGKIGDAVWADTDADGVYDGGESGIDGVTVKLYLDDGDGLFDLATDDLYATKTTGDDPNTGGTQQGHYQFTSVLPNDYWVQIDPSNYSVGNALAGYVPTTTNSVAAVTVTDNLIVSSVDIGATTMQKTWSLATPSNFTVNAEAAVTSGRATTTSNAETAGWWNPTWQYRRPITVTAGTEVLTTTHTIDLAYDLSTLVSAGKVQADFDDVRLVYWNGSTNTEVDLDVLDGNTQRFKIQTQISASGSDVGYYLYYGNPDITERPTRLANVYDYYSSFNQKDGTTYGSWEEMSDTLWAISGNKYRYNATTVGDRHARDTSKTINLTDDWVLESTITINSGQIGGLSYFDVATPIATADRYYMNLDTTNNVSQFFHYYFGQVGSNTAHTIDTGIAYRVQFFFNYLTLSAKVLSATVNEAGAGSVIEGTTGYDIYYPGNSKNAHPALGTYNGNVSYNDLKGWQLSDASVSVGSEGAHYPVRNGTVQPIVGEALTYGKLTAFRAGTLDQGGTAKFVLSDDGGTTWWYHNGTSWVTSDSSASQANTAAEVNAQAATFPIGQKTLLWKGILTATANQQPTVLHVGATVNTYPTAPTIGSGSPADGATLTTTQPTITMSATDIDSDALQYQIQFDTVATFDSANLKTYTQATSQTGWSGQNAAGSTAYTSGSTATFVVPDALVGRQYYWRTRAVDSSGSTVYSSFSATRSAVGPTTLTVSTPIASAIEAQQATISWTTNLPASSLVEYGPTTSLGTSLRLDTLTTSHQLTLPGLQPLTTYYYRVSSTDASTQTATSSIQTFMTPRVTSLPRPLIITPTSNQITYSFRPLITGLSLSGTTVFLFVDDVLLTTVRTSVDPSGVGHFFYRMPRDLTAGSHTLHALARNDATNERSPYTEKRTFLTFPRSAPTLLIPAEGLDTKREQITISGLAWRWHDVQIYIDDIFHATITPPDRGERSSVFQYRTPRMSTGDHIIKARHRYPDGTKGPFSSDRTITVIPPDVMYTVRIGDTLWSVAEEFLGDGSRYPEIIDSNQDRYPNLSSQLRLTQGQVLRIYQ